MDGRVESTDKREGLLALVRQAGYRDDELGAALVRLAAVASVTQEVEQELGEGDWSGSGMQRGGGR